MQTGVPKTFKVYLESVGDTVSAAVRDREEDEVHVETNCGGVLTVFVEACLP